MRNPLIIRHFFLVVLSVFLCTSVFAQDKVRLKAEYVKVMNEGVYFDIQATAKVNDENVNVSKIELVIYNLVGDEQVEIGKTITNMQGKSRFALKDINSIKPDSSNTYNIDISFAGNDKFSDASKSISFKNADIEAKLVSIDSVYYVTATLIDKSTDSLVVGESLKVQIQRMFKALPIGEEFNETDEDGTILVPIPEGIPGVDGILAIEVVLSESEEFGTVKAIVNAPIGKPVVDESTFDERTMWSPRSKTPLFLLIFPNLLIFAIWGIIIYLITNLFKITKS
ncbi:MAG: hypothetical protein A3F91_11650 [Flavobacteria bacterium RIFCSPLOWO2_12_FULL_35_11]|nr:MAG: hypothetical protein A3F91_11650 [Flavobacteria bacterium RIFCSPLOWO2_12_FULL_35_11]